MKAGKRIADGELPKLKSLASEFLAAEIPELSVLDQIATLAGEIAGRMREAARQQLVDLVAHGAQAIFPAATEDLQSRVAQSSHDELSRLGGLLDAANTAQTAFRRADADLMAARDRGEYAAMAPLALAADTQKKAFAAAGAEFATLIGLGSALTPDIVAAEPVGDAVANGVANGVGDGSADRPADPAVADEGGVAAPAASAVDVTENSGGGVAPLPESEEAAPLDLDRPVESLPERRRIRDLIRQMRPVQDEAV